MSVGNPFQRAMSLRLMSHGPLESLAAQRIQKAAGQGCSAAPCVLFGRNVEIMRDDIPWTKPCICHAICIAAGIDPRTSFLVGEGLLFSWWMCGVYTALLRRSLQKKYHLKNSPCDPCACIGVPSVKSTEK